MLMALGVAEGREQAADMIDELLRLVYIAEQDEVDQGDLYDTVKSRMAALADQLRDLPTEPANDYLTPYETETP